MGHGSNVTIRKIPKATKTICLERLKKQGKPIMPFSVQLFKSLAGQKGFMRTNKFQVEITKPQNLWDQSTDNVSWDQNTLNTVTFRCEASSLPGVQVATHEVKAYGYGPFKRKPYNVTFTDVNLTILADETGEIWKFFRRWIDLVFNTSTAPIGGRTSYGNVNYLNVNYLQDYTSPKMVLHIFPTTWDLNKGDQAPKISIEFFDAFPIFLGDIRLDWADNNQIMKIPLTFSFSRWDIVNMVKKPEQTDTSLQTFF